jgi:hypothetical protein
MAELIEMIRSKTDISLGKPVVDNDRSILPYDILLTPPSPIPRSCIMPLSVARREGKLAQEQLILVDLQIGQFLGQMHSNLQNDWFGLPTAGNVSPQDPSYSWQESFTALFESYLTEVSRCAPADVLAELPIAEIRQYLSRAIAYFLFDDAEVPSLIWFTGSEDDIYISLIPPAPAADGSSSPLGQQDNGSNNGALSPSIAIAAILPSLAHAIWGDPLLETFFMPPGPSEALMEGYKSGGGESILVFPRQKTKRCWYTMFLALVVYIENKNASGDAPQSEERMQWAISTIKDLASRLKTLPYF